LKADYQRVQSTYTVTEIKQLFGLSERLIRRWTEQGGYTPWQPLFSITDVYKPIQPAFTPAMHAARGV